MLNVTQNCIMISHNSGIVSIEKIIDHMRSPIDSRVARPLIRTVADKNNIKYMMLRITDIYSFSARLVSRIFDNSQENAIR